MNTITPQEASRRIASYNGKKGVLRIREIVQGKHFAGNWRDNHLTIPCGCHGKVIVDVRDCNIAIGGESLREPFQEQLVCGQMVPSVEDLTLIANVERGMVWGKNIIKSWMDLTIEGIPHKDFSHGFLFENCEKLGIEADVHDIGVQDMYLTGQGYGGELKRNRESTVKGKFRNCRFGVVFTEAGWGNRVIDIIGDENMIAEADFHSGLHEDPVVIGVRRLRVGNITHGAKTIRERFLEVANIQRIAKA